MVPSKKTRWMTGAVVAVAVLAASGCAPGRLMNPPEGWPSEWRGLALYSTPHAYIYASSDGVAGEMDRLVQKVSRDARRRLGIDVGKGLVIAANSADEAALSSPEEHYYQALRVETIMMGGVPISREDFESHWAALSGAMAEEGIEPETEVLARSVALDSETMTTALELPHAVADGVDWAVGLSSRRCIEVASKDMMNQKIAARGTGPLAVVAVAPLLVIEESRMVNNAIVERDVKMFTIFAHRYGELGEEVCAARVQAYTQRKLTEAMAPVFSAFAEVFENLGDALLRPQPARTG